MLFVLSLCAGVVRLRGALFLYIEGAGSAAIVGQEVLRQSEGETQGIAEVSDLHCLQRSSARQAVAP